MSLAEELPVYKAGYDLVLAIFEQARNFKKEYKYTIGESLKKETIALITNIYRANCVAVKGTYLAGARENAEVVRLYLRLLKDLRQISVKQLVLFNSRLENVSRQLAGWHKSQTSKQPKEE